VPVRSFGWELKTRSTTTLRVTREMADDLVARKKCIHQAIVWFNRGSAPERFRFDVSVVCEEPDESLRLIGNQGRTNWSIVLLTSSGIPLRKLTVHPSGHTNPDGTNAGHCHKHTWDDLYKDKWTYFPPEINCDDVNEGLLGFLKECNIECKVPPERIQVPSRISS
jgi:hypothetical protein